MVSHSHRLAAPQHLEHVDADQVSFPFCPASIAALADTTRLLLLMCLATALMGLLCNLWKHVDALQETTRRVCFLLYS